MAVDRKEVEELLAQWAYTNSNGVIAECCRAWLALDAAPEGFVIGQSGPDGFFGAQTGAVVQMDDPASVKGKRVRLVPETTGARMRGVG